MAAVAARYHVLAQVLYVNPTGARSRWMLLVAGKDVGTAKSIATGPSGLDV